MFPWKFENQPINYFWNLYQSGFNNECQMTILKILKSHTNGIFWSLYANKLPWKLTDDGGETLWTCCFLKRNFLDWTTWACACSIVFLAHTLRHEEFGCKSRKLCDESMKMCWGTSNTCFIAPRASSSADAHQKFHSETQAALNLLLLGRTSSIHCAKMCKHSKSFCKQPNFNIQKHD